MGAVIMHLHRQRLRSTESNGLKGGTRYDVSASEEMDSSEKGGVFEAAECVAGIWMIGEVIEVYHVYAVTS